MYLPLLLIGVICLQTGTIWAKPLMAISTDHKRTVKLSMVWLVCPITAVFHFLIVPNPIVFAFWSAVGCLLNSISLVIGLRLMHRPK